VRLPWQHLLGLSLATQRLQQRACSQCLKPHRGERRINESLLIAPIRWSKLRITAHLMLSLIAAWSCLMGSLRETLLISCTLEPHLFVDTVVSMIAEWFLKEWMSSRRISRAPNALLSLKI